MGKYNKKLTMAWAESIDPNEWNGNRAADDELVESVRRHGLLQPVGVIVNGDRYVCVYGERRLDAAKRAGAKRIPCVVYDGITKDEARMLTLTENIQREAQDPVIEGRNISHLVTSGQMSPAEIAKRMGKSVAFVARRMRLADICPQAEKILDELRRADSRGYDTDAVAMLAACDDARQVELLERSPHLAYNATDMKAAIEGRTPLDGAAFDPDDPTLPNGPCSECQKRTGAQEMLFGDSPCEGGSCLDPKCFADKTAAHVGREISKIRAKHGTAPVVVDKRTYDFATEPEREIYDANGAKPMTDERLATTPEDKARTDARTAIVLDGGTVREVVVVPFDRKKDGRAAKPKTQEERDEYVEKKRVAWMANQAGIRLGKWLSEVKGGKQPYDGQDDALLLALGRALAGETISYPDARRRVVDGLWRELHDVLYVPALFALIPEIMIAKIKNVLLLTGADGENVDKTLERLKSEAAAAVPE